MFITSCKNNSVSTVGNRDGAVAGSSVASMPEKAKVISSVEEPLLTAEETKSIVDLKEYKKKGIFQFIILGKLVEFVVRHVFKGETKGIRKISRRVPAIKDSEKDSYKAKLSSFLGNALPTHSAGGSLNYVRPIVVAESVDYAKEYKNFTNYVKRQEAPKVKEEVVVAKPQVVPPSQKPVVVPTPVVLTPEEQKKAEEAKAKKALEEKLEKERVLERFREKKAVKKSVVDDLNMDDDSEFVAVQTPEEKKIAEEKKKQVEDDAKNEKIFAELVKTHIENKEKAEKLEEFVSEKKQKAEKKRLAKEVREKARLEKIEVEDAKTWTTKGKAVKSVKAEKKAEKKSSKKLTPEQIGCMPASYKASIQGTRTEMMGIMLNTPEIVAKKANVKTQMCNNIEHCTFGVDCKFAHDERDLHWGVCTYAEGCNCIKFVEGKYFNRYNQKRCDRSHPNETSKDIYIRLGCAIPEIPRKVVAQVRAPPKRTLHSFVTEGFIPLSTYVHKPMSFGTSYAKSVGSRVEELEQKFKQELARLDAEARVKKAEERKVRIAKTEEIAKAIELVSQVFAVALAVPSVPSVSVKQRKANKSNKAKEVSAFSKKVSPVSVPVSVPAPVSVISAIPVKKTCWEVLAEVPEVVSAPVQVVSVPVPEVVSVQAVEVVSVPVPEVVSVQAVEVVSVSVPEVVSVQAVVVSVPEVVPTPVRELKVTKYVPSREMQEIRKQALEIRQNNYNMPQTFYKSPAERVTYTVLNGIWLMQVAVNDLEALRMCISYVEAEYQRTGIVHMIQVGSQMYYA